MSENSDSNAHQLTLGPFLLSLTFKKKQWDHVPYETYHMHWALTNGSQQRLLLSKLVFRFVHVMAHAEDFTEAGEQYIDPQQTIEGGGSWFSEWLWLIPKATFKLDDGGEESVDAEVNLDSIAWPMAKYRTDGFRANYEHLATVKQDHVLVLGKDTGAELELLINIKESLASFDLIGVLLKDLRDIDEQTVEEKLVLCAAAAAFAIVENTTPSGHIDELRLLASNRVVTAVLQKTGTGATWMQADYPCDFNFIKAFAYSGETPTHEVIGDAVAWAKEIIRQRVSFLNQLYPWRHNQNRPS